MSSFLYCGGFWQFPCWGLYFSPLGGTSGMASMNAVIRLSRNHQAPAVNRQGYVFKGTY